VPGLNDRTPHFLVSGATGSGKSVALRSAVLQLSADSQNQILLVDGKMGESLKAVERLPCVVGPCAVEGPEVRGALGWAAAEMRRRYGAGYHNGRVVVVIDEFQELVGDDLIVDLLRKLVAQGRAAKVHTLLATQHPTVDAFGDSSIRRNLVGKVALHVLDADASRVAVGASTPRADHLLGAGDSYAVSPGNCHRVQLAYVDEREITAGENGGPGWRFSRWPEYDAEEVGQDLPTGQFNFTGDELGVAVVSAAEGEGRTLFTRRMEDAGFGRPGYNRQKRLRDLGLGACDWMERNGYTVCKRSAVREGFDSVLAVW
jgi:DNA segregation ATPase FtsK/SpoIIIE-like protein